MKIKFSFPPVFAGFICWRLSLCLAIVLTKIFLNTRSLICPSLYFLLPLRLIVKIRACSGLLCAGSCSGRAHGFLGSRVHNTVNALISQGSSLACFPVLALGRLRMSVSVMIFGSEQLWMFWLSCNVFNHTRHFSALTEFHIWSGRDMRTLCQPFRWPPDRLGQTYKIICE